MADPNIFNETALKIMKRIKDYGGAATCKQLSDKYGGKMDFYRSGSVQLGRRVAKAAGVLPDIDENGEKSWWPIMYVGRIAKQEEQGSFVWKLRDELLGALEKTDLSTIPLYEGEPGEELEKEELPKPETYTESDFLSDVYISKKRYEELKGILEYKKNIILQGAPGTGKTFAAVRLAWSMMKKKDDNRIEMIQFHQNYSYEDFIMGYKPIENGFELRKSICKVLHKHNTGALWQTIASFKQSVSDFYVCKEQGI